MIAQLTRAFSNAMNSSILYIVGVAIFVTYFYYGKTHLTVSLVVGTISIIFAIRMEVIYFFTSGLLGYFEGKASCRRIQVCPNNLNLNCFSTKKFDFVLCNFLLSQNDIINFCFEQFVKFTCAPEGAHFNFLTFSLFNGYLRTLLLSPE